MHREQPGERASRLCVLERIEGAQTRQLLQALTQESPGWWVRHEAQAALQRLAQSAADQSADIEGLKLSRFDKVLALNRERLKRVYRGLDADSYPVDVLPSPGD
jgi:hypothetical protein